MWCGLPIITRLETGITICTFSPVDQANTRHFPLGSALNFPSFPDPTYSCFLEKKMFQYLSLVYYPNLVLNL
jgi:hypothetical protein